MAITIFLLQPVGQFRDKSKFPMSSSRRQEALRRARNDVPGIDRSSLRQALEPPKPARRFRLKPFTFDGEGQQNQDWAAIRELIYQGRGGVPE